jgi:hypothetical protein
MHEVHSRECPFMRRVSDVPAAPGNVGYRGQTGKHVLGLSLTGFDPFETCAAQDFRNAKSIVRSVVKA